MARRLPYPVLIAVTLAGACHDDAPAARGGDAGPISAAPPRDAGAIVAADPCAPAVVRAARNRAQAALTGGDPAETLAILEALACPIDPDQPRARNTEAAWAISDLAFARFKLGDLRGCFVAAESQLLPDSDNAAQVFDDSDRVVLALRHSSARCREAIEEGWGSFASVECPLDPDSHGIPAEALGPDRPPSCLEIAAGSRGADGWSCGAVSLISWRDDGTPTRVPLRVPTSQLSDRGACCHVSGVGFARAGDALRIRVDGDAGDCGGGAARSAETTIYQLTGTTLTVIDALRATAPSR